MTLHSWWNMKIQELNECGWLSKFQLGLGKCKVLQLAKSNLWGVLVEVLLDKVQAMDSLLQLLDSLLDFFHDFALTHGSDPVTDWQSAWQYSDWVWFWNKQFWNKTKQWSLQVKLQLENKMKTKLYHKTDTILKQNKNTNTHTHPHTKRKKTTTLFRHWR